MISRAILLNGSLALPQSNLGETLFYDLVVSNDLAFICSNDPRAFSCIVYMGSVLADTVDKRDRAFFEDRTFNYVANYVGNTSVRIWAHSDRGSKAAVGRSIELVAGPLGNPLSIPLFWYDFLVNHKEDVTAFGKTDLHLFIHYLENIHARVRNKELEETVFHRPSILHRNWVIHAVGYGVR